MRGLRTVCHRCVCPPCDLSRSLTFALHTRTRTHTHTQSPPRPPRAPQPTVVFREDQAGEDEWSLVDLHLKNNAGGAGVDSGATTMLPGRRR